MKLFGNVLAALDVETTGTEFGVHEILQVAVVPLDEHLKPSKEHKFFYMNVAPKHPERQTRGALLKHGLDAKHLAETCVSQERAADLIDDWFMKLNLPVNKRLIPLAHNWAFERGFMSMWLGLETFENMFHIHPRDTFTFGLSINDLSIWNGGDPVFQGVSLVSMCRRMGIELDNAHDALADCLATATLYREMLRAFG